MRIDIVLRSLLSKKKVLTNIRFKRLLMIKESMKIWRRSIEYKAIFLLTIKTQSIFVSNIDFYYLNKNTEK